MWAEVSFVLSQSTEMPLAIPGVALAYMQSHGKNLLIYFTKHKGLWTYVVRASLLVLHDLRFDRRHIAKNDIVL